MSTIASPRASLSVRSPPPSSRTSLDTTSTAQTRPAGSLRRNRAALRDYYGLKSGNPADGSGGVQWESVGASELDREGFDAEVYVRDVLAREGLEGVLRVEAGLISEIRGLDGERKALVYDNYSKLIAATDTIRKMRTNMDPLIPATSTLSPAISHIAETAAALSTSLVEKTSHIQSNTATDGAEPTDQPLHSESKEKQRQTVQWALNTPHRLRKMVAGGQQDAADAEWTEVRKLLEKWEGADGVVELKNQCEAALQDNMNGVA